MSKIIEIDEWMMMELNTNGAIFIDGIPVSQNLCTGITIGKDGSVTVNNLVVVIDNEKDEVACRVIKGHVTIQLKEKIHNAEFLASFGFKLHESIYHDQPLYELVELTDEG